MPAQPTHQSARKESREAAGEEDRKEREDEIIGEGEGWKKRVKRRIRISEIERVRMQ